MKIKMNTEDKMTEDKNYRKCKVFHDRNLVFEGHLNLDNSLLRTYFGGTTIFYEDTSGIIRDRRVEDYQF